MQQYNRRDFLGVLGALSLCGNTGFAFSGKSMQAKHLSDWKEGMMDIHHISTGLGNSTFIICPDGTTMLIDAGERNSDATSMPPLPNGGKSAGEWIVDYIRRFSKPLKKVGPEIDYFFLTHFHGDHFGYNALAPVSHAYPLAGISMVAEHLGIGKIVDRGWPDYKHPTPVKAENYRKFVDYQHQSRGTVVEGFDIGSNSQFVLRNKPDKYDFRIQNIYASGTVWTGEDKNTKDVFAEPDENMCSCVVKMTYGAFRYYSGGDFSIQAKIPARAAGTYGKLNSSSAEGRALETIFSKLIGEVDVMIMDHHACSDGANTYFLDKLRPQVMVIPAWHYQHPDTESMVRMCDKTIYPDKRLIFSTGMCKVISDNLGATVDNIKSWGHVVVRIYEKGEKFKVFVLDSESENPTVKYSTDYLYAKNLGER
jgi:beta-lactamase superfamily II metal-dependent hydrolase